MNKIAKTNSKSEKVKLVKPTSESKTISSEKKVSKEAKITNPIEHKELPVFKDVNQSMTDEEKMQQEALEKNQSDINSTEHDSNVKKNIVEDKQFVVFILGNEEFGVNINKVVEITKLAEITRVPNSEEHVLGVINLRGKINLIIDLDKKLGLASKEKTKNTRIMIIETEKDTVGMLIDCVKEVMSVKEKEIQPVPAVLSTAINKKFLKNVIIKDERIIIILDLVKLVDEKQEKIVEVNN